MIVKEQVVNTAIGESPDVRVPSSRRASERFEVDVFKKVEDETVKVDTAPEVVKKVRRKSVEKRKASVSSEVVVEEEVEVRVSRNLGF